MSDAIAPPETVDLSNMREITGGDKDLEKELFQTFIKCGEESLEALTSICADGNQPDWKEHSHSIKGEAANLGAMKLAKLCQQSQESFAQTAEVKRAILSQIKEEWQVVKAYLIELMK